VMLGEAEKGADSLCASQQLLFEIRPGHLHCGILYRGSKLIKKIYCTGTVPTVYHCKSYTGTYRNRYRYLRAVLWIRTHFFGIGFGSTNFFPRFGYGS
jgi:hypothetical protein